MIVIGRDSFSSRNAVNNSSARTTKRFPSPRCASAIAGDQSGVRAARTLNPNDLRLPMVILLGSLVACKGPQGRQRGAASWGGRPRVGQRQGTLRVRPLARLPRIARVRAGSDMNGRSNCAKVLRVKKVRSRSEGRCDSRLRSRWRCDRDARARGRFQRAIE